MQTPPRTHECTFCSLIRGSAEVSICHEDADAIAFMDIQPVNAGHVLVVPRAHYESLLDVPQDIGMHLFRVTMRLAGAVRRVTGCHDMNIVINSGIAAGQDEPHYHVHIIPRRAEDGFNISLPFDGSAMPERTQLDAMAARIGAALRDPMRSKGDSESGRRATDTWSGAQVPESARRQAGSVAASPRTNGNSHNGGSHNGKSHVHTNGRHTNGRQHDDVSIKQTVPVVRFVEPSSPAPIKLREGAHGELLRANE